MSEDDISFEAAQYEEPLLAVNPWGNKPAAAARAMPVPRLDVSLRPSLLVGVAVSAVVVMLAILFVRILPHASAVEASPQLAPAPHVEAARDAPVVANVDATREAPAVANVEAARNAPVTANVEATREAPAVANVEAARNAPVVANVEPVRNAPAVANVEPARNAAAVANITAVPAGIARPVDKPATAGTQADDRRRERDVDPPGPSASVPAPPPVTPLVGPIRPVAEVAIPSSISVKPPERTATPAPAASSTVVSTPAPSVPVPAPAAEPAGVAAAAPAVDTAAAAAVAARATDETAVRGLIGRYVSAYHALDVGAAKAVWPSVDTKALGRAFAGLESQSLYFADCQLSVAYITARAQCVGTAEFVPRVGNRTARREYREWTFEMKRVGDQWTIARVDVH